MTPLLEVEGIAVALGGREPVSNVSFTLGRGECLGIVGETGSGKSLSCRAVTGTLGWLGGTVTRGSVRYGDRELVGASSRTWRELRGQRIALVPQDSLAGLDPVMAIGTQLTETVRYHHGRAGSRARALELLEQVRMSDPERVFTAYPHQLSGGMRQRVMIALAIAGGPDVLVADEPTTALDVTVQKGILDLLGSLRATTGMSLILVTHDLAVVDAVSDRTVVMYAGNSVESGRTVDVLTRPAHPYTAALLAARPSASRVARLVGIAGAPPSAAAWPDGCRFAPRCAQATEVCRSGRPRLEAVADDRATACVRHSELTA